MITVAFHSSLWKYTENIKIVSLEDNSYLEIVRNLMSLFPKLENFVKSCIKNQNNELAFIIDNSLVPSEHLLFTPPTNSTIHLCPILRGSGGRALPIIIGVALIAAALFIPGGGMVAIASNSALNLTISTTGFAALTAGGSLTALSSIALGIGANLILSTIFQPKAAKISAPTTPPDAGSRRNNDVFGALDNTLTPAAPVPLNYGLMRVAGHLVSGYIKTVTHSKTDTVVVGEYFA